MTHSVILLNLLPLLAPTAIGLSVHKTIQKLQLEGEQLKRTYQLMGSHKKASNLCGTAQQQECGYEVLGGGGEGGIIVQ